MLKYFALLFFTFSLASEAKEMNQIDAFVRDHCTQECTGDTNDCRICYNQAVDLYDQSVPVSPEVNWQLNRGKLEFSF